MVRTPDPRNPPRVPGEAGCAPNLGGVRERGYFESCGHARRHAAHYGRWLGGDADVPTGATTLDVAGQRRILRQLLMSSFAHAVPALPMPCR